MRFEKPPLLARSLRVVIAAMTVIGLTGASLQGWHWWRIQSYDGLAPACRVSTNDRIIALSFDDGPDPRHTPAVLDLLERANAEASFFVIGRHVQQYPSLVQSISASGNELGSHTWSHQRLTDLTEPEAVAEILRGWDALSPYRAVKALRVPYGEVSAETLSAIRDRGFTPVHWSVPMDHFVQGLGLSPRDAAAAIAQEISPGDIVLTHDGDDGGIDRDGAIETLRYLLPMLRAEGWSVVSVGTLLAAGDPVPAAPRFWFWQRGFECRSP